MAGKLLRECLALFNELEDEHYALIVGYTPAWITLEQGDRDGAAQLLGASLAEARRLDNRGVEAESLAQLGLISRGEGTSSTPRACSARRFAWALAEG